MKKTSHLIHNANVPGEEEGEELDDENNNNNHNQINNFDMNNEDQSPSKRNKNQLQEYVE